MTRRLARWQLCLSDFGLDVVHRVGIKHQPADAVSQLLTQEEDNTSLEDELSMFTVGRANAFADNRNNIFFSELTLSTSLQPGI